jgi:hypothetical protein
MKAFFGIVFLLVVGYFLAPIMTTVIIFLFKNGVIGIINLGVIFFYYLSNGWALLLEKLVVVETILCGIPFRPVIAWFIASALIAGPIAFLISVKGLRRSYWKVNLTIILTCLALLVYFYISSGKNYQQLVIDNVRLEKIRV